MLAAPYASLSYLGLMDRRQGPIPVTMAKKDGGITAAALGEIRNFNQAASAEGVAFSVAFA